MLAMVIQLTFSVAFSGPPSTETIPPADEPGSP